MISHRNVISNVLQISTFEKPSRDARTTKTDVALGLLPLSHIYGLVVIAQASTWRGDEVIILPKFELQSYLKAIQTYKIQALYLVRLTTCYELFCTKLNRSLLLSFRWLKTKGYARNSISTVSNLSLRAPHLSVPRQQKIYRSSTLRGKFGKDMVRNISNQLVQVFAG